MKKVLVFAFLVILASCAKTEQEVTPQENTVPEGYKVITIKATKAEFDTETKTSYANDKVFSWSVGDKISVLCNNGSSNFWQTFTATTAAASSSFTATVEGTVNLGPLDGNHSKVAMYPASADHYYNGNWSMKFNIPATRDFRAASGGHQEAAIPMFAWGTDSDTYVFSNLTGAAKFTFKGIPCETVKMTFTASSSKLNGTYSLLYDSINKSNPSNVQWNAVSAGDVSEKTVTYYADVVNGRASFYLPYATGSIWGNSTLKLYDASTDAELYSNDHVGTIEITKNRIAVLPTLDVSTALSAFGINWAGVTAAVNTNDGYPAIRSMKATKDNDYLYILLDVDPSQLIKTHTYDHYFNIYVADAGGSNHNWNEKNKMIEKQSWAVVGGEIAFKNWDSSFSDCSLNEQSTKWTYEIRIHRDFCSELSGDTIKIGVELDDIEGQSWTHMNGNVPYGVIPSYGTDLYTVSAKPAPTPDPLPESPLYIGFSEASGEVLNPERGFYQQQSFHFNGGIPSASLWSNPEPLVLVLFYLEDFRNSDISSDALTRIWDVFDNIRAAGKKAIVRFGYINEHTESSKPWDAGYTQIRSHIAQVKPILTANEDIIYIMQAGFVGVYGEWYYVSSDFDYSVSGSVVTGYDNRAQVITDLLDAVPNRQVSLRSSKYKRFFLNPKSIDTWTPIAAWGTGNNNRLGFYNDGFRGGPDNEDVGTFESETDYNMWYSQSAWVITGGEAAYRGGDDVESQAAWLIANPDQASFENAITAIHNQHFSYLNSNENNILMDYWDGESHGNHGTGASRIPELRKALGYRLVLGDVDLTYSALTSGSTVNYSIKIKNTGSAPVYYPRPFKLVMLHSSGDPIVLVNNLCDVRNLAPGADYTTLSGSFDLTANVVSGDKLAIWLPDNAVGLRSNPAYSIRLANKEISWTNGYNVLYTF